MLDRLSKNSVNSHCLAWFYIGQGLQYVFSHTTFLRSRIKSVLHKSIKILKHVYAHTYIYLYVCMYICINKYILYTYIHTQIHKYIYVKFVYIQAEMRKHSDEALFQLCCLQTGKLAKVSLIQWKSLPLLGKQDCRQRCWYCYLKERFSCFLRNFIIVFVM